MKEGVLDTVKFEEKTALTNDTLNIVLMNNVTGSHMSII
jgi:hypothetical protein